MENRDYYNILGVLKDAKPDQIKAAYRDLAFKYHPDRNTDDAGAAENMKQVNEAYAVLSDNRKRRDYDALRNQYGSADAYSQFRKNYSDQDIFKGTDIHAVFNELAKSFGFRDFNDLAKEFNGKKGNTFAFKRPGMDIKGVFFFGSLNFGRSAFKQSLPGLVGKLAKY